MSHSKGYFHSLRLNASSHMLEQSFESKVHSAENHRQTQKYPKKNSFLFYLPKHHLSIKCHYVNTHGWQFVTTNLILKPVNHSVYKFDSVLMQKMCEMCQYSRNGTSGKRIIGLLK